MHQPTLARTTRTETSMSPEEKTFFQQLGERIAALRNERGLTQVQLADALGYSQQQVLSIEKRRQRMPVWALPELSKALGVPVEELLGADESRPAKRGPTPSSSASSSSSPISLEASTASSPRCSTPSSSRPSG